MRSRLAGLVKRSFSLSGHRTSIALETEFWQALTELAAARGETLSALVAALDKPFAGAAHFHSQARELSGGGKHSGTAAIAL